MLTRADFDRKFVWLMSTEYWKISQKFEMLNFDRKLVFLLIFIAILYRKFRSTGQFRTEKHSKMIEKVQFFCAKLNLMLKIWIISR